MAPWRFLGAPLTEPDKCWGAFIIIYTILWVPYDKFSIIYLQTLFYLVRSLYYSTLMVALIVTLYRRTPLFCLLRPLYYAFCAVTEGITSRALAELLSASTCSSALDSSLHPKPLNP